MKLFATNYWKQPIEFLKRKMNEVYIINRVLWSIEVLKSLFEWVSCEKLTHLDIKPNVLMKHWPKLIKRSEFCGAFHKHNKDEIRENSFTAISTVTFSYQYPSNIKVTALLFRETKHTTNSMYLKNTEIHSIHGGKIYIGFICLKQRTFSD